MEVQLLEILRCSSCSGPLCLGGGAIYVAFLRCRRSLGIKRERRIGSIRHEAINLWQMIGVHEHEYCMPQEMAAWFRETGFVDVNDTTVDSLRATGFGMVGIRRHHPLNEETTMSARTLQGTH